MNFPFEQIDESEILHCTVHWSNKYLVAEQGENRKVDEAFCPNGDDERTQVFDWGDKKIVEALRKWATQMTRATQTELRKLASDCPLRRSGISNNSLTMISQDPDSDILIKAKKD